MKLARDGICRVCSIQTLSSLFSSFRRYRSFLSASVGSNVITKTEERLINNNVILHLLSHAPPSLYLSHRHIGHLTSTLDNQTISNQACQHTPLWNRHVAKDVQTPHFSLYLPAEPLLLPFLYSLTKVDGPLPLPTLSPSLVYMAQCIRNVRLKT